MTVRMTRLVLQGARAALAIAVALSAARAPAQPGGAMELPVGTAAEHAWSVGVPEARRQAADLLFKEGNALLHESITLSAVAKYREALRVWDHPNIHYNLALALMTLDQPVETRDQLVAALRYGATPLGADRFEHARNYVALLDKQLARIRIRCDVVQAIVQLDGKTIFIGPGEQEVQVRTGRHTVVASREGLVTNSAVRTLEGGQTVAVELRLQTIEELTESHRRWPAWKPWAVLGAGAVVAGLGGGLHASGLQAVDRVNRESKARCPAGCAAEPSDLASDRRAGILSQRGAMVAYGVGGAAIVTGAVLAYLNRPQRTVRPYDSAAPAGPARVQLELAPLLDGDGRRGLVATLRY
jgi:hypothetical protein